MTVDNVPSNGHNDPLISVEALKDRVDLLRARDEPSRELVQAIVELTLRQLFRSDLAISLGSEILSISKQIGYVDGEAWGHGLTGMGLYMLSRHDEALQELRTAKKLAKGSEDIRLHAGIENGMAQVFLSTGDFEKALECGIKALRLARKTGNEYDEAWLHHGMSTAYADLGDVELAYDHACKAHEMFLDRYERSGTCTDRVGLARSLSAKGSVLITKDQIDDAEPMHQEALHIFRECENEIGEARALNDLGLVAHHRGDFVAAEANHRQSLAIREKINNVQAQSTSLLNLARVLLATGRQVEALSVLRAAQERAEQVGARVRLYQIQEAFAEAHEALGNTAKALESHRRFHSLREEILGEAVTARIRNRQVAFEIEQSEREAELIKQKNEELHATNEQLNRLLEQLQRAQDRLVHAEKMASLGQLTAGIAHEIKNPLNFVTNFSAMNLELVRELSEILSRPDNVESDPDEVTDLVEDIVANTERIFEHGKRADSIIRGMLLHARGGSGDRVPVDFNDFVDEYVKLAYQGFRAQHPEYNTAIDKAFDPSVGEIMVAGSDLGRVILNLVNNALFALEKRCGDESTDYRPVLQISTVSTETSVELRVRDNGSGIPEEVKSRVFEPFFTTKDPGEGTGLGLSLSHDIVSQGHGGELYVDSALGEYTEFVVSLPKDSVER